MRFFKTEVDCGGEKWNWVDENNRFLGFDGFQYCCESFGFLYHIVGKAIGEEDMDDATLAKYRFTGLCRTRRVDGFPKQHESFFAQIRHVETGELGELELFNCHNGFYGHGFEFGMDSEVKQKDYL